MQAAYGLCGGKLTIKKYKVAASHAAGIIVLRIAEGGTGVATCTTTGAADAVGLTLDQGLHQGETIAYSTTQGDPEALYSVCINPDLVMRALLVGSAANAVMTSNTITTAASNGLSLTAAGAAVDFTSPDCDEGLVWYTSGPNAGQSRVVTASTSSTVLTVVVPFAANTVGDTFLVTPLQVGFTAAATFSTNLLNVRGDLVPTGAAVATVDHELNGAGNSYIHIMIADHVFAGTTT